MTIEELETVEMEVSDNGRDWHKAVCLKSENHVALHDLEDYVFYFWRFVRTVQVEKKRWMTREEVLLDNLNNPRRLVRIAGGSWKHIGAYAFSHDVCRYEYIDIPEDYKRDFSDLVVKKYEAEE